MFKQRSKVLFICAILSLAYTIYLMSYFGSASAEDASGAIATVIILPHLIAFTLGTVFVCLGFFLRKATFAMVGSILFCVAAVLFIMYAPFTIPMIILGFVGFAKQKKLME